MSDKPFNDEEIQAAMADSTATDEALRNLRRMMLALIGVILVATLALVVVAAVVASNYGNVTTARDEASTGREVAECAVLFDRSVTDARDVKADASYDVTFELGRQLLESGASHPPAAFNPLPILAAAAKRDQAATDYATAEKARDDWLAAGSPLPCPIQAT